MLCPSTQPANGLDPAGVLWLREATARLSSAQGRTILLLEPICSSELAQTVDDVIVIDRGRLLVHGSMAGLLQQHKAASLEDLFFGGLTMKGPTLH